MIIRHHISSFRRSTSSTLRSCGFTWSGATLSKKHQKKLRTQGTHRCCCFCIFLGCYWLDFQLLPNSPWFCLCLPHLNHGCHGLTPFWSIGTPFLSSPEAELHHRQASPHVLGGMASTWWNPLLAACFLFRKPSGNSMVNNGQKKHVFGKVAPW